MNIAAVVLAGGYSSRMGAFKPLLKLGKSTAVELAVNCFLDAGVSDVRVVAGFRAPELLAVLKPLQARVITNPHFEQGMYASVQVAVDTFEPEVDAFYLPVDSPLVSSVTTIKCCPRTARAAKITRYSQGSVAPLDLGRQERDPGRNARKVCGRAQQA